MKDMMEYKGYFGSVHYCDKDEIFYGKVKYIRSLITYEGDSVNSLKSDFYSAVDDYLLLCEEEQRTPEEAFKGTFNVRVGHDLHREAAIFAESHDLNINQLMIVALKNYLSEKHV